MVFRRSKSTIKKLDVDVDRDRLRIQISNLELPTGPFTNHYHSDSLKMSLITFYLNIEDLKQPKMRKLTCITSTLGFLDFSHL